MANKNSPNSNVDVDIRFFQTFMNGLMAGVSLLLIVSIYSGFDYALNEESGVKVFQRIEGYPRLDNEAEHSVVELPESVPKHPIDTVELLKDISAATTKAISNQLNVYDMDWIEEANDFSLTDKQFQIARNSVIALNTGLNPCDQTSIFFKIKGRQIVQANSFQDLAVLSYFCEHPDAFVWVAYE